MATNPLAISSCDLLKSKNTVAHHTEEYDTDLSRLVVRRGQPFHLRLSFTRNTNFPADDIRFEFRIGGRPMTTHKSKILLENIDGKSGDAKSVGGVKFSRINTGDSLDVEILTPTDMGTGQWTLVMYWKQKSRRGEFRSTVTDNIVMLFNAWNKDDEVYMENPEWRKEYVLNDTGRQYYGSARRIGSMAWYFGQYETEVLNAVLKLISMERLPYRERGNPVAIARHLSALVNANDDNGVLVGNWSGEYDDGVNPSDWIGSYAILKKYWESKSPVLYGQCWVFAGVLCTTLRALGIPARCVTNFESAHDTDANLTIDYHYDEKDKSLDNDDSIWNFHVWNDVWMARSDLPKGFGGWQALDATPQEESSGKMRCGPMSINAIKQGLIYHDYDGPFIYAEVNGTKRHWKRVKKNPEKWEEIMSEPSAIGKNMSTKKVGSYLREDVTHQYKFPEGTPEENLSFKTARKYVTFTKTEKKETADVVKFDGDVPDSVPIGKDVVVSFKVSNISKSTQEVYVGVVAKVMQYNGSVVAKIHDASTNFKIPPGGSEVVRATLKASTYLAKAKSNNSIKFFALGGVKNPAGGILQSFAYHDSVEFEKPEIKMELSHDKVRVGKSVQLTVSFNNTLSQKLPAGKLRIEGSGMAGIMEFPVPSIASNGTFSKTISITPKRAGTKMIMAGFSTTTAFSGLLGSVTLTVIP